MKTALSLILTFCYVASFCQQPFDEQISSSRFEIIKNTIEFLATDAATFRHVQKTTCDGCESYADLEAFIKTNDITGAGALVNEWKNAPIDVTPRRGRKDLDKFTASVISKITAGPEKGKRMKLPEFGAYKNKLATIVAGLDAYDETTVLAQPPATESETGKSSGALKETAGLVNNTLPMSTEKAAGGPISFLTPYVAYGAAGVFALLAIYLYMEMGKQKQYNAGLSQTIKDITARQRKSDTTSRTLQLKVNELKEKLEEAGRQFAVQEEKYKKERDKNKQAAAAARVEEIVKVAQPARAQKPAPAIKFARYADLEDGFSNTELLDRNDNETIFEITITSPGSATYRVSGNEKAQRYALTNVSYFLSNTCWYDTFPKLNDLIRTDEPGKLTLQGNKWVITSLAKISFI